MRRCPQTPGVYRFRKGRKIKGRVSPLPSHPLPHSGARVALQQNLILQVGRQNIPGFLKVKKAKFIHSKSSKFGG